VIFTLLKDYIYIFFMSMVPVLELRAAIPVGVARDLQPFFVWLTCVVGNMVPVPFIMLFIAAIFRWMKKHGGTMEKIVDKMEQKAEKGAQMVYRYELLGLFILVAIPLPGTGAWTGALVAAMLRIRLKTALPVILAGVIVAGLAMLALSCGVSYVVN